MITRDGHSSRKPLHPTIRIIALDPSHSFIRPSWHPQAFNLLTERTLRYKSPDGRSCYRTMMSNMFHIVDLYPLQTRPNYIQNSGSEPAYTTNWRKVEMDHPDSPVGPSNTFLMLQEVQQNFPFARSQRSIYGFPVHNCGKHLRFQDLVSGYFHNVLREHDVIGSFSRNDGTQDVICERCVSGIDSYS